MKEVKTAAALRKELDALLQKETKDIQEKHYPSIKAKYEGRYFKYRNSYSDKQRWWMYTKVTEIKKSDVYDTGGNGVTSHYTGYSFQKCSYGNITIEPTKRGYVHYLGTEITEAEFNEAWNKLCTEMDSL